jgi:hypothetical protein
MFLETYILDRLDPLYERSLLVFMHAAVKPENGKPA